jgi:hypothetical protein
VRRSAASSRNLLRRRLLGCVISAVQFARHGPSQRATGVCTRCLRTGTAYGGTRAFRGGWEKIGGPASSLVGGGAGLIATNPDTEEVWRYAGSPFNWNLIGGPGAEFVVNNVSVYGLSPDRSGVWRWGGGGRWYYIGGPAEHIYGGFETLLATNRRDGNVWSYNDIREEWTNIGGPGREFVADQYYVYGLSPDRSGVQRYGVNGWEPLGGGYTEHIYAGRSTLLALDPAGVRMWVVNQSWDVIGGPGQQYVINDVGVFGRDGNGVWKWTPGGTHWSKIGGPAATIAAA